MDLLDQYRENKRKRLYDRYRNTNDTGQKLKLLLAILDIDGVKINGDNSPKNIANNKKCGIIKVEPFNQDDDLPDGQHWITSDDGHKLLLDKNGTVIAGAGGTLNGVKLSEAKSETNSSNSKSESGSNSSGKKSSESGATKAATAKVKKFGGATTKAFANAVSKAKAAMAAAHPDTAWRVTAHSQEDLEKDYPDTKLHVSDGGSTVAVTSSGDIISVCKHPGDKTMRGKDILALAVENGGKKLDSYDGNHGFYIKCGFEPVSWCEWDDKFKPDDWDASKGCNKEHIIFYKYTGKTSQYKTVEDFYKAVPASADYDAAQKIRDDSLEE